MRDDQRMPKRRLACPRCKGKGAFVDEQRCCVCSGEGALDRDAWVRPLKPGQLEFLQRVARLGADTFADRDWALALPLRDQGLIGPEPHPFWRFIPLVGPFKQRIGLTWLGRRVVSEHKERERRHEQGIRRPDPGRS